MESSELTRPLIGILATLLVTGALFEALGQESLESPQATHTSTIELLQKRHSVLSQLVKLQTEAYRQGGASIEAVVEAHQELVQVELELAVTKDQRIALLDKAVHLARALVRIASAQHELGKASMADVLKSQSETLRVEIVLLRERRKAEKN